ncbi:hypothetical protein PRZ48_003451 [Zasmidium cellare]|uniref:GA4 desaturase n=1 Tax=Zasmidium cellare TaxID=395010 RepID=A0ABR0EWE0_ZASCE|nr:hypothetical protein PRZ48_003451 [Zasmidium cellare]
MGSIESPVYGIFKYGYPTSQPPSERSLYTFPEFHSIVEEKQILHDFRDSPDIVKGPAGLDVQGFTYVDHQSALDGEDWFDHEKLEKVYIPEIVELVKRNTGANKVAIDGLTLRKTVAKEQDGKKDFVMKKGDEHEKRVKQTPRDSLRMPTRESAAGTEPARTLHVDYSLNGLKTTARYSRTDIAAMAKPTIEAEEAGKKPRYAAYGVWRPLDTVKRDPLAMLDARSIEPADLLTVETRTMSGVKEEGEVLRETIVPAPPKNPNAHRWYWMPEQKPHEAVIIKFADTAASETNGIASGCVHGSPKLPGTENEPVRASINCRVLAFWD